MLFVDFITDEILSDRVATIHPGYYNWKKHKQPLPFETNKSSTAYIDPEKAKYYFCGGFYGGKTSEMLKLFEMNMKNIYKDLENNYIAVWHDESHTNKYFNDNTPTKILTPDYCFPEDAKKAHLISSYDEIFKLKPKLIALSKDGIIKKNI